MTHAAPLSLITRSGELLAGHTTFRIGGPAEQFVVPRTVEELRMVIAECCRRGVSLHVLGRGSNLLVADEGVRGVVVSTRRLDHFERRGSVLVAQAGAFLPRLVHKTAEWGLSGLEPLVGIPGTIGGALVMNAGGRHGTIAALVRQVTIVQPDGNLRRLGRDQMKFAHRDSNLKGLVVAEAELELKPDEPRAIRRRYEQMLDEKKRSQPMSARSAGCVFRNPPGASAGALIDLAQMKSYRVGDARVSTKHANFIINDGAACARDVLHLMEVVRTTVAEQFKVSLQNEVELWGFEDRVSRWPDARDKRGAGQKDFG